MFMKEKSAKRKTTAGAGGSARIPPALVGWLRRCEDNASDGMTVAKERVTAGMFTSPRAEDGRGGTIDDDGDRNAEAGEENRDASIAVDDGGRRDAGEKCARSGDGWVTSGVAALDGAAPSFNGLAGE
jgi:hypothetical protein